MPAKALKPEGEVQWDAWGEDGNEITKQIMHNYGVRVWENQNDYDAE